MSKEPSRLSLAAVLAIALFLVSQGKKEKPEALKPAVSIGDKERSELLDYQKTILEVGPKAGEAFDRTIYALAGAALAFAATYLKDFRGEIADQRHLFAWTFILLLLSMLLIAVNQFVNQEYIHALSDYVTRRLNSEHPPAVSHWYARLIRCTNVFALLSVLGGIALFLLLSYNIAFTPGKNLTNTSGASNEQPRNPTQTPAADTGTTASPSADAPAAAPADTATGSAVPPAK